MNYRVGIYGFFDHPELKKENPDYPSNFGILDQIEALRWIKSEIKYFGGNPDKINVFG